MVAAGAAGLAAGAPGPPGPAASLARGRTGPGGGTPEQVRLAWEDDPARTVVVSWAARGRAERPRVRIGQRVIPAVERARGDGRWTYRARVDGLRPGATYGYAVTADNDASGSDPFSATFTTAPAGRTAFRFTSFGDLAAPGPAAAAYAVGAVETFQPLFHLLNGDLADSGLTASAAYRPWLPAPGGRHDPGSPPDPGGRWYAFRVGTALFVCLSGDDVPSAGAPPGGDPGRAQTRWLEAKLAAARGDASIDWIVVQLHPCACSSDPDDGSDLGIRREWLPLFDAFEADLVLAGHGHRYERSFPVRGTDPAAGTDVTTGAVVDTRRPHPVTTVDSGVFDTSQGTVHLVLGSGALDSRGSGSGGSRPAVPAQAGPSPSAPLARVLTGPAGPDRRADGAVETATWSARRDASAGYGIAVFDVSPGSEAGGQTSVTVRYYHAVGGDYALFDTFTLVRPRSDGRRWHPRG
jgi:Purple acid Phosphatase, N-terminal domain